MAKNIVEFDKVKSFFMKKIVVVLSIVAVVIVVSTTGCAEQIDAGFRGVKINWGEVDNSTLPEGLYFYIPVASNIIEMDAREQVWSAATEAYSKDVQKVNLKYTVNFYPERGQMHAFYRDFGVDYVDKIIPQIVYGTVKAVVGKHIAVDLISQRQMAVDEVSDQLKTQLSSRNINMTRFEIVNLTFDSAFEKAVESKVIAIQNAEESKNKTVRIEEEAKQMIIAAEAEARSMQIKSDALSKNQNLINYEAVLKWNGILPQYMMGNTVPFLNIK